MILSIRKTTRKDIPKITMFIRSVFDDAVAPNYTPQGNEEFYKYINAEAITGRFGIDHWILKAEIDDVLVGIIEIRKNEHVSMLFVDSNKQRQGVGRRLLSVAIDKLKQENPKQTTLSVHSSPNAVPAYKKLGFEPIEEEQMVTGIRFTTMEKQI